MPIARKKGVIARVKKAQRVFDLNLKQTAAELQVTPEWLSKLMNGHHPISYNLGLRVDDLLRRRGIDPAEFDRSNDVEVAQPESRRNVAEVKDEIARCYRRILRFAKSDPNRLAWILQQMRLHLRKPKSWKPRRME